MENQLWNLFRETGDPLGYLYYRAGDIGRAHRARPGRANAKPARRFSGGGGRGKKMEAETDGRTEL